MNDWLFNIHTRERLTHEYIVPESKVHGPTWGPPGSCRPQMGPMLAPITLLSRVLTRDTWTNCCSVIHHTCMVFCEYTYPYALMRVRLNINGVVAIEIMTQNCDMILIPESSIYPLWRYPMETFSALLDICAGNSPVTSKPRQWRGALMFSLICAWTTGWVNNREAGDLRRHRTHYDVIVMIE